MSTLIHRRVKECQDGLYPKCIARISSGWVVLGDVQFVRGYSLVLPDPVVPDLNQMAEAARVDLLREVTLLGDVLLEITGARRINYEILGNLEPALHVHLFPRYDDEPEQLRLKPVWFYDWDSAPAFDLNRDQPLMQSIKLGLEARGLLV
jgi:diadenosine tetraphosphate (Ap4A) HIT family hydrolase